MPLPSLKSNLSQAGGDQSVEISAKGKPVKVPPITVNASNVIVKGKWVKIAMIHDEEWLESELENPELCVKEVKASRASGLRADIISFAQKLPATERKYQYPMEWDSIAAIRLTSYQEWWEKLPQESRKNVRRSQKRGVVVRCVCLDDVLVRGLVELNNDSPIRQGRPYAHYGKSFGQVMKDQSSFLDRSDFVGAYRGDELVGFMKIVYRGDSASILQLLPKASHSDKRPANALLAKAVELCASKGMSHLVYGMYNYGNKGDNSLREFKSRHGFEEILVPRYFIPLTAWGALCMKVNLHRPLVGILPGGIIRFGIALRSRWYRLKASLSRCSSMLRAVE
jgi:hypothetical protein